MNPTNFLDTKITGIEFLRASYEATVAMSMYAKFEPRNFRFISPVGVELLHFSDDDEFQNNLERQEFETKTKTSSQLSSLEKECAELRRKVASSEGEHKAIKDMLQVSDLK